MTRTVDPAQVARFRDLVRGRTGMALPESRASDLERAVQRAAADLRVPDAASLYDLLLRRAHRGDPLDALVSALNVSETHFFRDANQIQALQQRILPELIARRRPERRLRLWSAGCSTGEEAYTLAILVERLLPDLAEWDVLILATDINGRSLERARRGLYGPWSFRGTSPLLLSPYLTRCRDRFEVVPDIRAMVTFGRLNLAEDVYPSFATKTRAMDLVLCRNVLVYFDEDGGAAVVRRLRKALADGGWLLVSRVEAGLRLFDGLVSDGPGTAIYRKLDPPPAQISVQRAEPAATRPAAEPDRPRPPSPVPRRQASRRLRARGVDEPSTAQDEALRLWRSGQAEAALRWLDAATASRPLAAPLHYLSGLILLDRERTDEALAAFRRCTCADPEFTLAHLAQAGLFAKVGLRARARAALETAARLADGLAPGALVYQGDGQTVGEVLELIAAQQDLLIRPDPADGCRG